MFQRDCVYRSCVCEGIRLRLPALGPIDGLGKSLGQTCLMPQLLDTLRSFANDRCYSFVVGDTLSGLMNDIVGLTSKGTFKLMMDQSHCWPSPDPRINTFEVVEDMKTVTTPIDLATR